MPYKFVFSSDIGIEMLTQIIKNSPNQQIQRELADLPVGRTDAARKDPKPETRLLDPTRATRGPGSDVVVRFPCAFRREGESGREKEGGLLN